MKRVLLILFIVIFIGSFSSCEKEKRVTICSKDNFSNFGQFSAVDASGNMFYVSKDKIVKIESTSKEKVIAKGRNVNWITVSDNIFCIENNDTLVCYDIKSGEKLAEKKFETDKMVAKAIDDRVLVLSYIKYSAFQRENIIGEEIKRYIVNYNDGELEVKTLSSGENIDGGYVNTFIKSKDVHNVYFYYDDTPEVCISGEGFDDVFFLDDDEYFGARYLFNDYPYRPFLFDTNIYLFEWKYILNLSMPIESGGIELPEQCTQGILIDCFDYNSSMFCIFYNENIYHFFKIDMENKILEEVGSTEKSEISTVIGHYKGYIYFADESIIYAYNLLTKDIEKVYETDKNRFKPAYHYEFCGNKLLICKSEAFGDNIELVDLF